MQHLTTAIAIVSIVGGVSAAAQQPAEKVTVLKVSGMHCGECAKTVEKEAKKIDGVKAAKVDQPKGEAQVSYDPGKTSPEAIAKHLKDKTGFKVEHGTAEKK